MTPGLDRRVALEAAAAALVVCMLHVAFRVSGGLLFGAYEDDGVYVALGKAIASGAGYRSIHLVGAPLQLRYPPGLPLLLAIPWGLGGSLGAVRSLVAVANVAATALAGGLVWWVGRRALALTPWSLAVCAVGPLCLDATIQLFNIPLSEPYFVLGWSAALALALPLAAAGPAAHPPQVGRALVLGLVLAATVLFRTAAVALIPAVLAALWIDRRRVEAVAAAAAAAMPLGVWAALRMIWAAHGPLSSAPDDLGYWRWLGAGGSAATILFVARSFVTNAVTYAREIASLLLGIRAAGLALVGAGLVLAAGGAAMVWRRHRVVVLTVAAVLALTLLWPFAQSRLLLPLLPFIGLLVAAGLDRASERFTPALRRAVQGALVVVAALVAWRQADLRDAAGRAFLTGEIPPPADRSPTLTLAFRSRFIVQVSDWVRLHTRPEDRIMVQAPSGVYLYTGRRTVAAAPTESPIAPSVFAVPGEYLARRILNDSLTLVVWTPATVYLGRDIATLQARCPGVLTPADTSTVPPRYFRVGKDDACLRDRMLRAGTRHDAAG